MGVYLCTTHIHINTHIHVYIIHMHVCVSGERLMMDSRKMHKQAKHINLMAKYKKLAPVAAIVFVCLFVFWWRFF
jgi:hypothetical protein